MVLLVLVSSLDLVVLSRLVVRLPYSLVLLLLVSLVRIESSCFGS